MHSLDPLLKGLILKVVIVILCGLATLLAIPSGILLTRKVFSRKSKKVKIVGGSLLTLMLFLLFTYALASLGAFSMYHLVVKPSDKRECIKTMTAICLEGERWAETHEGRFPSELSFVRNQLSLSHLLFCRGDHRQRTETTTQSSYEIVTPAVKKDDIHSVFLRCAIHGHLAYTDGAILDGPRER